MQDFPACLHVTQSIYVRSFSIVIFSFSSQIMNIKKYSYKIIHKNRIEIAWVKNKKFILINRNELKRFMKKNCVHFESDTKVIIDINFSLIFLYINIQLINHWAAISFFFFIWKHRNKFYFYVYLKNQSRFFFFSHLICKFCWVWLTTEQKNEWKIKNMQTWKLIWLDFKQKLKNQLSNFRANWKEWAREK